MVSNGIFLAYTYLNGQCIGSSPKLRLNGREMMTSSGFRLAESLLRGKNKGHWVSRNEHDTCMPPVIKAWTKKKPENQNIDGCFVSIHLQGITDKTR
jgi:hypothetical protein